MSIRSIFAERIKRSSTQFSKLVMVNQIANYQVNESLDWVSRGNLCKCTAGGAIVMEKTHSFQSLVRIECFIQVTFYGDHITCQFLPSRPMMSS